MHSTQRPYAHVCACERVCKQRWLKVQLHAFEKFLSCFKAQYAVSAVGALLGLASAEHALVQCEV